MEVALAAASDGSTRGRVLRAVAWRMLVGVAAGGVAGFLVGGIGGRLAMLVLRLTSPDSVIGMESDDGFEIGVVTSSTVPFVFAMTMIGGFFGVLYAVIRPAIAGRLRLPLFTLFGAAFGGAAIVHDDGIDSPCSSRRCSRSCSSSRSRRSRGR